MPDNNGHASVVVARLYSSASKSSGYIEDDEKKSIFGKILSKNSIARTRKWKCIILGMEVIV